MSRITTGDGARGLDVRSIAVVGVGMMGRPIARRLIDAGYDVIVCDSNESQLEEFRRLGVTVTTDVRKCTVADAVLVLVNTAVQMRQALQGAQGLLARVNPSRPPLVAVMSTAAPEDLVELGRAADAHGVLLIDAPVSGGDGRAEHGTLTVMAGGPRAGFDRLHPVLECLADSIFYCGPLGSGATLKLLNNVVNTLTSLTMAEVLRLAREKGIAPDRVAEVLEVSTGRNVLTAHSAEISRYYERFSSSRGLWESVLALLQKDATAATTLVDHDPGSYPVIEGLPGLLASLGAESYENWRAAAGLVASLSNGADPSLAGRQASVRVVPRDPAAADPEVLADDAYPAGAGGPVEVATTKERRRPVDENPLDAMQAEVGPALPQSHARYAQHDPELFTSYLAWRDTCLGDGALSRTQKLLMVIALLVSQRSGDAVRIYASIALSEGATKDELKEALRVGVLFSGGSGIDAASRVADLLES